jgi:hypothetical protein
VSHLIPKLNRLTLRVLLVFIFISGILAYSYVDRTVYTTAELIVVPGTVSSDGFAGIETVLMQDVDGDGLYQNFSTSNSAYTEPVVAAPLPINDAENSIPSSSEEETGAGLETTSTTADESSDESGTTNDSEETQTKSEEVDEPEAAPESEPAADTSLGAPQSETSSEPVTLLKPATATFRFAQFDETTPVVTPETSSPDTETITSDSTDVDPQPTDAVDVVSESTETTTDSDVEVTTDEDVTDEEVITEADDTSATVSEEGTETEESLTDNVAKETPLQLSTSTEYLFGIDACKLEEGCKTRSLLFDNFALPEFAPGTILDTVQLRMSLAAKAKENSLIQRFVVSYSLDFGATWLPGTVIDVDGEIANSINGDHFLMSIDVPKFTNDISGLQVKVAYEGIEADLDRAYVDGVWLEVTSGSFYEENDFASTTDTIDYARDLNAPQLNVITSPDVDVVLGAVPAFNFEYEMQQNFFKRIFKALFSENTFTIKNVTVQHSQFGPIDIPYEVVYHEGHAWSLSLPNSPQKMHPGKYQVTVTIDENDQDFTDSFEFYWGVLAINTTKSMYEPDEPVTFNLAALTDDGDTICDAKLQLQVVTPDNAFFDVPVTQSGACNENNVTDIPDYLANFTDTADIGLYTVTLLHLNKDGEVVHKIQDSFEVREFIPYVIERTAPTRIYPPAMYDVAIKITAHRTYDGDVVERVPRGFIVDELTGATISTLPEYTEIRWADIAMVEGEERTFSYRFDAPDISPYLYLLGPLDMDGFGELRAWQIASDALSGIAWFTSTSTIAGSNLNGTASQLRWSTSSIDSYYYEHSTTTSNERVTLRQPGDYFVAVNLPQQRADANSSRTRIGLQVRVNGVAVPEGLGQSGYIRNANGHSESSSHVNVLLTNIAADDYIEVYAQGLTTIDGGDIVNVTGLSSMYLEYMSATEVVFAATTTSSVASTSLNTATSALSWTETRQDTGFVHSNSVNPENITISDPGVYMVQVSLPLAGTAAQQSVLGKVLLNGVQVSGGQFAQGYQQSAANENDAESSIHWSGIVVATTSNQILTITVEQEAAAGTVLVPTGYVGNVFVQKMPTDDVLVVRGRNLVGGTDWSPGAAAAVQWDTQLATSSAFTHSTTTNSHQITVTEAGSYVLTFNGAFTQQATGRSNHVVQVQVGGVNVPGAQAKSNYIRNQSGHSTSSSALTFMLENLATSSVVTVTTLEEGNAATVNDSTDAVLMMWKKLDFNARPDASTLYNTPFDNTRFASTSPYFEFSSADSDGVSDLVYEFSISTTSDFATATIRTSDVDAGFRNTASSTDTSPFTETEKVQYQLQPADVLTDLTTYYWRVRAKDVSGSNTFGDWSTTQSLTVDLAATSPYWYQTSDGQFTSDSLVGTISSGENAVVVDAANNQEILLAYGEGSVTTPRYRLWNGTVWGTELDAVAVGGTINWLQTAAGVTRDEYVMVTLDATSASYAQVYQASTTSWGNQVQVAAGIAGPAYRGIAVAYESLSGDAMVFSCDNDADPVYRTWNGTSWSATSTLNVASVQNCSYITVASDPASDEIIVVVNNNGAQYEALVWDGSAWIDSRVLGSSVVLAREGMAVTYEASGEQAVIVTSNGAANSFAYVRLLETIFLKLILQQIQIPMN